VSSALQADAQIPFTLDIRFADVQAVSPATVRAGVPCEVMMIGTNEALRCHAGHRTRAPHWRELADASVWRRGWV